LGQDYAGAFQGPEPALLDAAFSHPDRGVFPHAQQPYNNVVRTAFEGLAAVLGAPIPAHELPG